MAVLGGILAALLALVGLFGCGALTAFQEAPSMPMPQMEPAQPIVPQSQAPQPMDPLAPEATFHSDVIVTQVTARVVDGSPAQIELDVVGYNPDGCEYPVTTEIARNGNAVSVQLYRDLPVAMTCPAVVVDYASTVSLGAFEPGTYTISVNGFVVEVTI